MPGTVAAARIRAISLSVRFPPVSGHRMLVRAGPAARGRKELGRALDTAGRHTSSRNRASPIVGTRLVSDRLAPTSKQSTKPGGNWLSGPKATPSSESSCSPAPAPARDRSLGSLGQCWTTGLLPANGIRQCGKRVGQAAPASQVLSSFRIGSAEARCPHCWPDCGIVHVGPPMNCLLYPRRTGNSFIPSDLAGRRLLLQASGNTVASSNCGTCRIARRSSPPLMLAGVADLRNNGQWISSESPRGGPAGTASPRAMRLRPRCRSPPFVTIPNPTTSKRIVLAIPTRLCQPAEWGLGQWLSMIFNSHSGPLSGDTCSKRRLPPQQGVC